MPAVDKMMVDSIGLRLMALDKSRVDEDSFITMIFLFLYIGKVDC